MIYIFYRSQKTSTFQKDAGLFLSCHSLSKSGQTIGTMLGCSLTPRATDMHKKKVEKHHRSVLQSKVQQAIQVQHLICKDILAPVHTFHT